MSSKSILIIEDNHDVRALFSEILRDEEYSVIEAENGHEALDYLHTHDLPDLILMDLTFPKMTADEFVHQLNSEGRLQSIPLVVISGQLDTKEHASRLHAKGFLKKPFDVDHLVKTIKEISH